MTAITLAPPLIEETDCMLAQSVFEAFTGLAALLSAATVAALFLCTHEQERDDRREWTLRPRARRR